MKMEWKIALWVAVIGAIGAIAAAIITVVFPEWFKSRNPDKPNPPAPVVDLNQAADREMEAIAAVSAMYNTLPGVGEAVRMRVSEQSSKQASQMLQLADNGLDYAHRILKYEYASLALMMAAGTERGSGNKADFANKSIESANEAKRLVEDAEHSQLQEEQTAFEWAKGDDAIPRIDYIMAIDYCFKAHAEKNPQWKGTAQNLINGVPEYFRRLAPPNANPDLRQCVSVHRRK